MNKLNLIIKTNILLFALAITNISFGQVGQIIWEENFNTLDTTLWNTIEGDGGFGNWELQYYQDDNVYIEPIDGEEGNNALVLEARRETAGSSEFTSGKVTTQNKLAIKYGMIEVRMKVPDDLSTGLWPAAWLLGTNISALGWPRCGELDIMEMGQSSDFRSANAMSDATENEVVGANLLFYSDAACSDANADCAASIAYDSHYCTPYRGESSLTDRFLIYRIYWDDEQVRFTVDDNGHIQNLYTGPFPIGSDAQEFTKPFFFILNLAVGGTFTDASTVSQVTADLPGKMLIDYVRVHKWNGKGEVYTPGMLMANAGSDITVDEGDIIQLNASGSYGEISAYEWSVNDSVIANNKIADVTLPSGSHIVVLSIKNVKGEISNDKIAVTVGSANVGEIIWKEDFTILDTALWKTTIGDGCDEGLCGWGNNELQYYQNDNVYIEEMEEEPGNYALVLEARKEKVGNSEFTSGKITTEDKVAIKYGVIEVRMKVPDLENGLWPAAWLLGTNHRTAGWPHCGEIDMMEMGQAKTSRESENHFGSPNNYVGGNVIWYSGSACSSGNQTCAASIASDGYYYQPYISSQSMSNRYMTYRMYWDESEIRLCAVDNGNEYDLYTNPFPLGATGGTFNKPFYFLLDLAIGGNFTGLLNNSDIDAPMPAKMYVDYVKVNKWNGKGEVFTSETLLANAGADFATADLDKDGMEPVSFDGLSSLGNIVNYEWSENGVVIATGATATIEMATGAHTITLTITDSDGKTSTDNVKVEIREVLWEENFNSFESGTWNTIEGDGCDEGNCGFGNWELQSYQSDNLSIEAIEGEEGNSALAIEARNEQVGNSSFTSGKITTENKVSIKYGLIEVRMKVPDDLSTGLWPAAWMLGINQPEVGWPKCGEIDMMEMGQNTQFRYDKGHESASENDLVGGNIIFHSDDACSSENADCAASIAFDNYYCKPYVNESGITNRFLIYRTYWDQNQIRLTAEDNGVEYDLYTGPFPLGADAEEFHKPFYFILNLAVGGTFTDATSAGQVTADLPGKMLIDYVRVLKFNGVGEVAFENGLIPDAGADIIKLDDDGDGKETVILDGSSSSHHSGSIVSYTWLLNGEELATGKTAQVELKRGTYEIELAITDSEGNTATDKVNVTISSGGMSPIANAGADTTITLTGGASTASVMLDASESEASNTPLVDFKWFENGNEIASGIKVTVELKAGIHNITLGIMDEDSLTASDDIIITVVDPTNKLPLANAGVNIYAEDDNGDDLVEITLDGSASSDSDGSIDSYLWSINSNQIAEGVMPTVELSTGIYTIKLQVIDNLGGSSFSQVSATIVDPDNIAPIAMAGADTVVVDADNSGSENYRLDASLSNDSDGTIENYAWNVNNTLIVYGSKPTVDFSLGMNNVILTVTDNDGVTANDTLTVKVGQLPVANAGSDTLIVDEDNDGFATYELSAELSSDSDGSIETYIWYLNNTEIAEGKSATYNFTKGTNVVTLKVTDNYGLSATDEVVVIVTNDNNIAPLANAGIDISVEDADNNGQELVQLDASLSSDEDGTVFSYTWYSNDEEIATGVNPEVIFAVGEHTVTLIVTDNEGTTASDELMVTVTKSACKFVACTGDYVAKVISNNEETSIKFIPTEFGIGETTCLLFFGTADPMGANNAKPYEAFNINGLTVGETIYFYYTYSTNNGTEQTTFSCKDSFVVGDCNAPNVNDPVADAGSNQTVYAEIGSSRAEVTLDASASYDPDGTIESYSWMNNQTKIATGVNPNVNLAIGTHQISLLVTDNTGNISKDVVSIIVKETVDNAISDLESGITIFPQPVNGELTINSKHGTIQKLQLLDANGGSIGEYFATNTIDMSRLQSGLYLLKVTVNGNTTVKKVIKN